MINSNDKTIAVKVVKTVGNCPGGIKENYEISYKDMNLISEPGQPLCFNMITQINPSVWAVRKDCASFFHASCPGCIKDLSNENRVVCLIQDNERREMGDLFTEYWHIREKKGETEKSEKQQRG